MSNGEVFDGNGQGDTYYEDGAARVDAPQSCGSRIKEASCLFFLGIVLFVGSVGVLIWNEGRTVARQEDLAEAQQNVVEIQNTTATAVEMYNHRIVHITAALGTADVIRDPIFGIGSDRDGAANDNYLKLRRSVEMYQWDETKSTSTYTDSNGNKRARTSYSYRKGWFSHLQNSAFFHRSYDYENPSQFPFEAETWTAEPIYLGGSMGAIDNSSSSKDVIELSEEAVGRINWFEPVNVESFDPSSGVGNSTAVDTSRIECCYGSSGLYYRHGNGTSSPISDPEVGDVRVSFAAVSPDVISIVALLVPSSSSTSSVPGLHPYVTTGDGTVLLVRRGNYTMTEMFEQAQYENTATAWVIRFVGFAVMWMSVVLTLQPISILLIEVIPFGIGAALDGACNKCVFPIVALFVAVPTSLAVISLAWLAYRPYIAVPIFVVCLFLLVWMCVRARRKRLQKDDQKDSGGDDDETGEGAQEYPSDDAEQQQQEPVVVVAVPVPAPAAPYGGAKPTPSAPPAEEDIAVKPF